MHKLGSIGLLFLAAGLNPANAATGPVVLELFTSQSCSSCPPADALMKKLSESDSTVLPLSFHVDYWDQLSWKDTYSSPANTQRQTVYSHGSGHVFTPQLIVNGATSVVGNDESAVSAAITNARQMPRPATVSIAPADGNLAVTATSSSPVDIWEVRFDRYTKVNVKSGENGGRTLESVNNVTSFKRLGTLSAQTPSLSLNIPPLTGDGVAILAQAPDQGPILGAASFTK